MTLRLSPLASGNAGARQTAARMADAIRTYSPAIRRQAEQIVGELSYDDTAMQAGALYRWVQEHMRYVRTPLYDIQEFRSPDFLLWHIYNDGYAIGACVDYVNLLGALLVSVGIPVHLVLVAQEPGGEFDHVYLRVLTSEGPVAADAIHGSPFGFELGAVTAREEIAV